MIKELKTTAENINILDNFVDEEYIEYCKGVYNEEWEKRIESFNDFISKLDEGQIKQKKEELNKSLKALNQSIINQGWYIIESQEPELVTSEMEYSIFAKGVIQEQLKIINHL